MPELLSLMASPDKGQVFNPRTWKSLHSSAEFLPCTVQKQMR